MKKLNEEDIIRIFQKEMGNRKFVSEDVEIFRLKKIPIVAKIDTLVASTDIPTGMKLQEAIRKSVVACVSDFSVKGVKPSYGIVSLTIPTKFSKTKIKELANGLARAAKEFNFKILGGDTNEGKELVIQTCIFGTAKKIVQRKGAKINEIIITTGPFGYSSAGLKIILDKKKANRKFFQKAKKATFRPIPRLKFGLQNRRYFSSSMDSSDGLAITLHEMSRQSKKKFVITKLPANSDLFEFAKINRINPMDLIFYGGEEYEMVASVSRKNLTIVKRNALAQKIPLFEIGYVANGKGVVYSDKKKSTKIKKKGWLHFES